ncbi:HAMP domain-containing histidine kinase [Sphingobacterium sp. SRCM116780]|uniref:sensor histidine kinase n=1 Tax=Sphingobacterium sp. SRCM116780 TaxID=2907623 RepID=UPI001F2B882D|nr:HAMP domain-containing sensor histidine kinase [Sphingobacterium sp. SRCM116780]UIR55925.1 HAMP domain-containing histidine kinase [Sphingobacterium sp. SRCM116780]
MANKFKLLITLSVLTGIGIISILAIWLYGSYNNRLELFLSSAERSMFNVVQDVYQAHSNDLKSNQGGVLGKLRKELKAKYTDTEIDTLFKDLIPPNLEDKLSKSRNKEFFHKEFRQKLFNGRSSGEMIPPFLFLQIKVSPEMIKEIKAKFDAALKSKGIAANYTIEIEAFPRDSLMAVRKEYREKKLSWTRPILIDPTNSKFLVVKFDHVWKDLLFDLGWQLGISILLVSIFIGSFIYLFKTIFRQNRLAEMRKAFVNNMTHELKTPVSTVMAAVEAIQLYGVKNDREKMDRYLAISRKELDHLAAMIERVLQMDVDEISGVKLDKAQVDLIQLFKDASDTFKINVNKDVNIIFDFLVDEIWIHADGSHLRNIINNLLENAIKYSGDTVEITISAREFNDYIEFSVSDNGQGISQAYHKEIFNMFFRVPEGNLHQVKGFGIGLAYVRQIVQQHGGKITVKSSLTKGSTFTVKLPKL